MPLDDADVRAVLDVATELASEPVPEIEAVLDLVRSVIRCASVSFNDMTLATGDFRYVIAPAGEVELAVRLKPVYDELAHEHPLIAAAPTGLTSAMRFCDVPAGAGFTDTRLHREFFEPFGVRYQLVIGLPAPPDVVVGYALNRSREQGEFSDRDVAVLNALGAHLSLHHRRMLDAERAHAVSIGDDRFGDGAAGWEVLTARSDGVVEASSGWASETFASGNRLPSKIADLLPAFATKAPGSRTHDVMVGKLWWRVVVKPVPLGPTVLMVRPIVDEPPEATPLIDLGLTARQTQVAIALAESGGTNAQLARELGIAEGTLKKHLEAVFRVLGLDNRAAAAVALRALIG